MVLSSKDSSLSFIFFQRRRRKAGDLLGLYICMIYNHLERLINAMAGWQLIFSKLKILYRPIHFPDLIYSISKATGYIFIHI